jgi:hypothetical protein
MQRIGSTVRHLCTITPGIVAAETLFLLFAVQQCEMRRREGVGTSISLALTAMHRAAESEIKQMGMAASF